MQGQNVRRSGVIGVIILVVIFAVVVFFGTQLLSGPDDGIEEGKNYKLAATYRA